MKTSILGNYSSRRVELRRVANRIAAAEANIQFNIRPALRHYLFYRKQGWAERALLKMEMRVIVTLVPLLEEYTLLKEMREHGNLKVDQSPVARSTTDSSSADANKMPTGACLMAQGFD